MFLNETNKNSRLYGMQEFILKNNSTPCCAVHWAVYNNMAWWERNLEIFTDFRVIGSNIGDKMFTHANQPIAIVVWMYTKIQGKLSNCVPKMMTSMWSTMMSKYLWKARREWYVILNCCMVKVHIMPLDHIRFAKSSSYFWPIIRFSVFPAQFWIFSKWCLVLSLET